MRSTLVVLPACVASVLALVSPILVAGERPLPRRAVMPAKAGGKTVDQAAMQAVYEKVKTPYKYGIVLPAPPGKKVDCPSVYRKQGRWYMRYITFDGAGYETWLAVSTDLLKWEPLGRLLSFRQGTWDANQAAGFVALQNPAWGGSYELEKFDGLYWMSYCGGALQGYETDPLAVGIACGSELTKAAEWKRLEQPVLHRDQPDVRHWEKLTQYKSNIIRDPAQSLGFPFVMFYNAKSASGYERIGIAVSQDMRHWQRYGTEPVIDNGRGISGDPQVVRMGDLWVMFYFGAFWKPKAFDTFACSYDLVHWTKWTGPHLVQPSEPWDDTYAHKPWLVCHDHVVYHFYNAVGSAGRCIALATSKDLRAGFVDGGK